jgi:prolyl-tRNA synthetase
MGLTAVPMAAESGPIGGDMSHEFIILASTGESQVFCDRDLLDLPVPGDDVDYDSDLDTIVRRWTGLYAATDEKHQTERFAEIPEARRVMARGIEVGHIFYFGTKYSEPMGATVTGPDGDERPVHMGSYGIGPTRLVAAIIEASHDEAGIVWPESVAPFALGLLNLKPGDAAVDAACEDLYGRLRARGIDVLYDDTSERPGAKFATMDLIGLPWQLVVGPKGLAKGEVELKRRAGGERQSLGLESALSRLADSQLAETRSTAAPLAAARPGAARLVA